MTNCVPALREVTGVSKGIPSEHEMMVYQTMAKQAVTSKMYRGIGEESGVMMIMLAARELGIPAMQALNGGLNIIQGKVEISARMMNALIRKAGHQISVRESTENICTLVGKRCDTGESLTASFSMAEAQKAGLVKAGGGWTKWPKDMLFARALSRLARQLFSDVIGIGYVEGEIRAADCEVVIPPDEQPQPEIVEVENEQEWLDRFFKVFDDQEKFLAMQYLDHVMMHFGWSRIHAIKEFLKDEDRLHEKFQKWRDKHKL